MRRSFGANIGARMLPLAVAIPVVALDRTTKDAVVRAIGPDAAQHRIDLLGRWIGLEYAENRGAAFGLFGAQSPILPLVAIAIVLTIGAAYGRQRRPSLTLGLAVGLAVGGAIGNLIDRVRLGYVIDFIAIGPWPNFNVADSAVTLGVIGFVAWALWSGREADRASQRGQNEAPIGEGTGAR
jgi:signal peptidase II